jgi:hypothetical protein
MAQKKKSPGDDQLSIPAAVSEVARGVATARTMRPHDAGPDAKADAKAEAKADEPPQRSRAELKADIAANRVRLAQVVDEIEHHLDVPTRARQIAADFRSDPAYAVRTHKKTTVTAVVVVAAVGTGIGLLIRAIAK